MYTRRYPSSNPGRSAQVIPPPDYSGTAIRLPSEEEAEEVGAVAQVASPSLLSEETCGAGEGASSLLFPPPPLREQGYFPGHHDADLERSDAPSEMPGETGREEDGRLMGGVSRRPDLNAPTLSPQPRFTDRSPTGEEMPGRDQRARLPRRGPRRPMRLRGLGPLSRLLPGRAGADGGAAAQTKEAGSAQRQTFSRPASTFPRRPILPPAIETGYRPKDRRGSVREGTGARSGGLMPVGGDEWLLIGLLVLLLTGSENEVKGHLDLILLLGALLLIGR